MDKIALIFTLDEVFQTASEPQKEVLLEQMASIAQAMTSSEIYQSMLLAIECTKGVAVSDLDAEVSKHFGTCAEKKLEGLIQWINEGDEAAPAPASLHLNLH